MPARRPFPDAAQIPASRQIPDARPSLAFAPVLQDRPAPTASDAWDAFRSVAAAARRQSAAAARRPILQARLSACGRKSAFPAECRRPCFALMMMLLLPTEAARCKPDAAPFAA
jgi:hypothetical protein